MFKWFSKSARAARRVNKCLRRYEARKEEWESIRDFTYNLSSVSDSTRDKFLKAERRYKKAKRALGTGEDGNVIYLHQKNPTVG